MNKEFSKTRLSQNILRCAVYFAAVLITPWIAKPLALLFDWVCYSLMIKFFEEIFTIIFWILELVAFFCIERKQARKRQEKMQNDEGVSATNEENELKQGRKTRPLIPLKNVFMIFVGICFCILVISAQINFQVKLFYDIGQGKGGYDLVNNISVVGKNVVKCIWIVWILRIARSIAKDLCLLCGKETEQKSIYWAIYLAIVMLFALMDVLVSGMSFGFAVTYMLLFYPAFMAMDHLTEYSGVKTFFMIMIIYIL